MSAWTERSIGLRLGLAPLCGALLGLITASDRIWANQGQGEGGRPPQFIDEKDSALVKRLSRQELDEINSKLREAMELYYHHAYRLALPILEEIATRINTMDVLYWIGHAAYQTGQTDLAIAKFKTMLERDPNLLPVRLELAMAYLQKGDRLAAKAELQTVLDAKPPASLRQQIEGALATIALADKRLFASVRASIGPQYDTNINVGPGDATITLPGGGSLLTQELEGFMINSNAALDLLYNFGDHDGWVWRNNVYFLHNEYPGATRSDFNYTQIDARTALEYYAPAVRGKLPFGFLDRRFANEDLSHSFYFAPYTEYNLTQELEVALGYRYEDESFVDSANRAQNNVTHTVSSGPRYRFEYGGARHLVSLLGSYSDRSADGDDRFGRLLRDRFSYSDWSIGPSYFVRFKTGTELYLDARYLDRDYDSPSPFFEALGDRDDQRYFTTVAVSQTFAKNYFVSVSFTYIRNDSNVLLFDYEKVLGGINFGVNFNF